MFAVIQHGHAIFIALARRACVWHVCPSGQVCPYFGTGSGGGGAKLGPSTVAISFSPTAGEASMTPTTTAGASARTMVLAKVDVQNSGGYSVYLKSNNQNLVGQKNGDVIAPIAGSVAYNNLSVNT